MRLSTVLGALAGVAVALAWRVGHSPELLRAFAYGFVAGALLVAARFTARNEPERRR